MAERGAEVSGNIERIREALQFIPTGGHDERFRIGCMVKTELGDTGRDLWDEWRDGRGGDEATSVWKSISESGALKIGTLFHEAKANGWRDDGRYQKPKPEEIAERRRIAAERAAQDEAEIARERADTKKMAAAILRAATEAKADHPYLSRKRVSPVSALREIDAGAAAAILGYAPKSGGDLLTGRLLVVPVKQGDGLSTLELIDGDKRKAALAGCGSKVGGYWATERLPDGDGAGLTLLIGEGVATGLSASEATGHPAIAALSAGNLPAVAKAMRERYPAAALVILADLVKATGEPDSHAIEAAKVGAGRTAIPDFGTDRDPDMTDFNDMAKLRGADAVGRAITGAAEAARAELQPDAASPPAAESEDEAMPETGSPAAPDGPIPGEADRPCFRVLDDWVEHGGAKYRPGVWYFGTDKDGSLTQSWACSPIHLDAVTYDGQGNNFGRLLRFKTTAGKWREWAMPMDLLAGDGAALRGELLSMGTEIDPSQKARNLLATYLQARPPKRRMRCASQIGWCGDSFVLPDVVIGPGASSVIFQSGERGHDEHTTAGTLDGWRTQIAARAVGNPLLILALSASFTGPMMGKCNAESGGINIYGDSSTGKTTLIEAACATWGGANYRRSWRATANGMEGAAALFNDCLLALDEISECDPREVGAIVYALGNGRGKQRASRTGAARGVVRWRCFVLSSGERTIATTMQEGGHRAKAGQAVRLLDIPAARAFGAWDELHGAANAAAFSDALKRAAVTHHGLAGRAFLEKLTHDKGDFCATLEEFKSLTMFAAEGGEGQDKRAAGRFALIGLSGELATKYGLTGWPEGVAVHAAALAFDLWRAQRGKGNDERRQIGERVASFIERHGDGRFSDADANHETQVRDRAGWWRGTGEGREYLFTAEAMREALKGFDFNRTLDVLQEIGALPKPGADGKRARFYRIGGRGVKLYPINPDKMGGDHV
jgi:putative DNA primase/helicase